MDTVLFIINRDMHYRKIWEKHNGPIPRDNEGRSYEIHHLNGDRKDNNLDNLVCITAEEHYRIHLNQGDYAAAFRIAQRMEIDPEIKSELMSKANKQRLKKGEHPFIDTDVRKKAQKTIQNRVNNQIHGFQNKEVSEKAVKAKKEKYTHEELSNQVKTGWEKWKEKSNDPKQRTLQGSKAGADKTRGTSWYHLLDGTQLRCKKDDERLLANNWIPGRFNGKKLSDNANYHKLNKTKIK
jgi:hypothetical protein